MSADNVPVGPQGSLWPHRIVKFDGNVEPCTVYRVLDETDQMIYSEHLHKLCAHIKIEVVGMIPKELLVDVQGHYQNKFALDRALGIDNQHN